MKNTSWQRSRSSVHKLFFHIVFVTKYRRGVFTHEMLADIEREARASLGELGGEIVEFNGEVDHVHLLVRIPPKISISETVKTIKIATSKQVRSKYWPIVKKKLWGNHLWSPSYFAISCGGVSIEAIMDYIKGQERPD